MVNGKSQNAEGPAAGFLFQPERALLWLAKGERGSKVGIETGDDVVKEAPDGSIVLEQDKHSIAKSGNPIADTSINLWKTLCNWINYIVSEEIDLSKTEFFLVTNKIIPECLARSIGLATDLKEIDECCDRIEEITSKAPDSISKYASFISSVDPDFLKLFIKKVNIADGSDASYGDDLKNKIVSYLHLPSDISTDDVIHPLMGWLHDEVLDFWRSREPAWITREAFDNQLFRITQILRDQIFTEKAKSLIPVKKSEREKHSKRNFVKQLEIIEVDRDELIDSIDDFIRCSIECTRFSKEGNVTKEDFKIFQDALKDRWKLIRNRFLRELDRFDNVNQRDKFTIDTGYTIYSETMDHREPLAGQPTLNYYLTRGYYHRLSNLLQVGWHPNFEDLIKTIKEKSC